MTPFKIIEGKGCSTKTLFSELTHDDLLIKFIRLRNINNLTQIDVAKRLKTTSSAICRLEHKGGKSQHSPRIKTLQEYAAIFGCRITFNVEMI